MRFVGTLDRANRGPQTYRRYESILRNANRGPSSVSQVEIVTQRGSFVASTAIGPYDGDVERHSGRGLRSAADLVAALRRTTVSIENSRWCLRLVETVSGFGRWRVFWRATDRASSVELSKVRIGLETTEL